MSSETNQENFRIFVHECNPRTLKKFLLQQKESFIKITQEEILDCLDVKRLLLSHIKEKDFPPFISHYHCFEKKTLVAKVRHYQKNSEIFEAIKEQTNAAFFIIDPSTMKFIFSQGKGLAAFGLEENELVGKCIKDYYGNNKTIMDGVTLAAQGTSWKGILHIGSSHFHINFTPVSLRTGKVIRIVVMTYDISHNIENERKLNEMISTRDKFFSLITHDLKGPFGTVVKFLEALQMNISDFSLEEIADHIGIIGDSASNSYNLLVRLLEWAKVYSSKEFHQEDVNLYEATQEQMVLLQETAKAKNITITHNIPENMMIYADKEMLTTVIRNLVSNAIKFTGGKDKKGKVLIYCKKIKGFLLFSVVDDGIGMSSIQKQKLFHLDKIQSIRGTADEQGTGIGLLLCKEFIEKHNGRIRVDKTEEGKGTTINFVIPYDKEIG